jgi:hypothetical protein
MLWVVILERELYRVSCDTMKDRMKTEIDGKRDCWASTAISAQGYIIPWGNAVLGVAKNPNL